MGDRDHSITCEVCGLQRGGLNNYKCHCDAAKDPPSLPSLEVETQEDRDLDFEIKMMEHEGSMAPSMNARWQRGLTWLRELRDLRIIQRANTQQNTAAPQHAADSGAPTQLTADMLVTLVRFRRTVICAWCGNRYRSSVPSELDRGLQGSHCASDIVQKEGEWIVRGGYGSDEHDMHRYLFVANLPSAPADPVCDECISERLRAGDLRDTGLECERRPADFGPRPFGTGELVCQIRELVKCEVALRRLAEVACEEHKTVHLPDAHEASCTVCAAIREYHKHQHWTGELEDGGEKYAEGCPEVAEQLREAAKGLEKLAVFWEQRRPQLEHAGETEGPLVSLKPADEVSPTGCPHCQAGEPSVWDDVLSHYAHPTEGGLKTCHAPWGIRCLRCSTALVHGEFCAQHRNS